MRECVNASYVLLCFLTSVVVPDPGNNPPDPGSTAPDPKWIGSERLIKSGNFSTKMLNLKIQIPFYQKKFFPWNLYLFKICNLTQLQAGNSKVNFLKNIRKNSCRIRKSRIRIRKNRSGSTTLLLTVYQVFKIPKWKGSSPGIPFPSFYLK